MNIAIIPARGGSKRIPQKNTRNFCGKPISGYSIEAALETNLFEPSSLPLATMELPILHIISNNIKLLNTFQY